MIFVQDNSVQSINAALNVIQKNNTPAQTNRGRRFSSSATNKYSISVRENAISCYIPDFPELVANITTVKLILPQLDTGSPTLNINGLGAKPIKTVRNGHLINIVAHRGFWSGATRSSDNTKRVSRVWNNNTTLELIYDGTNWVTVGNPLLCSYYSTKINYRVYADEYIEQWGTYDNGSESRDIDYNEIFAVQFRHNNSFTINVSSKSTKTDDSLSMCYGVRDIQNYGIRCHIYGLNTQDTARYAMWQAKGY